MDDFGNEKPNSFNFTDDTALTKAVSNSLIECRRFDVPNMAKWLAKTYEKEPHRGYAMGAASLFNELIGLNDFDNNCLKPGLDMFNGSGSYGNGSGMRVAPIALYTYQMPLEESLLVISLATKITHSNHLAVMGAILQSEAIKLALDYDEDFSKKLSSDYFNRIIETVEKCEAMLDKGFEKLLISKKISYDHICPNSSYYLNVLASHSNQTKCGSLYSDKLKKLKKLLKRCNKGEVVDLEKFYIKFCDCGVKSFESIPVALFAFLVAANKNCENEVDAKLKMKNTFERYGHIERVILYAVSLGGDTDTIASMAGAIAGAFYGYNVNSTRMDHILKSCESYDETVNNAGSLISIIESRLATNK